MSNWILGKSIDSSSDDNLEELESFSGHLVHLEYPRCVIAVGNVDLLNHRDSFSISPDAGYFMANETKGFSLVLTEWLDEPLADTKKVADLLFAAASHYSIKLDDELEATQSIHKVKSCDDA
jgi:hypothetical protein